MESTIIREYKMEDKDGVEGRIFELQENEYRQYPDYWIPASDSVKPYLAFLLKRLETEDGKLFVADVAGRIAGFVAVLVDEDKKDNPCYKIKRLRNRRSYQLHLQQIVYRLRFLVFLVERLNKALLNLMPESNNLGTADIRFLVIQKYAPQLHPCLPFCIRE